MGTFVFALMCLFMGKVYVQSRKDDREHKILLEEYEEHYVE